MTAPEGAALLASEGDCTRCLNCGSGIVYERVGTATLNLGGRWVHTLSRIPLCRPTVATPTPCPSVYPPSADAPHEGTGWSGPVRCVLSDGHQGDRHWNDGINWQGGARS